MPSWAPFQFDDDYSSAWVLEAFEALAAEKSWGSGRVQLGFGIDNLYLPTAKVCEMLGRVRAAGSKLITSHGGVGGPGFAAGPSTVQLMAGHGVLGPDVIVSHANHPRPEDAGLFAAAKAWVSTTPNTELQMGWEPLALQAEFRGQASLGVDCHSWGSGYMPGQMRLLLQHARSTARVQLAASAGTWRRGVEYGVDDVFNLATVDGARAVGMAG